MENQLERAKEVRQMLRVMTKSEPLNAITPVAQTPYGTVYVRVPNVIHASRWSYLDFITYAADGNLVAHRTVQDALLSLYGVTDDVDFDELLIEDEEDEDIAFADV